MKRICEIRRKHYLKSKHVFYYCLVKFKKLWKILVKLILRNSIALKRMNGSVFVFVKKKKYALHVILYFIRKKYIGFHVISCFLINAILYLFKYI